MRKEYQTLHVGFQVLRLLFFFLRKRIVTGEIGGGLGFA
ncbi:MAG: hypothetical protein Edafosvirus12_21 [Edafosvirus sp.]|uniref:Uncharacterized protein n=1 Tax=Edafosvirus sp. TaxID=2487765 RepID=A0A3G4ZU43_9VIRU|nr:MAG: hypothetical protein Edafosvirus12_21 [Edafosvirus sp.]